MLSALRGCRVGSVCIFRPNFSLLNDGLVNMVFEAGLRPDVMTRSSQRGAGATECLARANCSGCRVTLVSRRPEPVTSSSQGKMRLGLPVEQFEGKIIERSVNLRLLGRFSNMVHISIPMITYRIRLFGTQALLAAVLLLFGVSSAKAQTGRKFSAHNSSPSVNLESTRTSALPWETPAAPAWQYRLLPGAQLIDDCMMCGRPTYLLPMDGTFSLRLVEENPLFSTYAIEDISFHAGTAPGLYYKISGTGTYRVGGEVALIQTMSLEVEVHDGSTTKHCSFTNNPSHVTRGWPLIEIALDQADSNPMQFFRMTFVAAPIREVWFSTSHGFTPGVQPAPAEYVRGGDLVSDTGRLILLNTYLRGRLGLMPSPDPPDLGLDCVDILPGGEVAFSIEEDAFSETLGFINHGDVLSDRSRVIAAYSELIAPFRPMPPIVDPGLDALQVLDSGEIYFSVKNEFFSESLGMTIKRGDLLSSKGSIVKTHEQLLARFRPPPIPTDFGLDAVHVWPSGEIWFSLEETFQDDSLGIIRHGDLLSDRGEIVYRNYDLLRNFQPLEELADFGLDAVFIVSDATALSAGVARCTGMELLADGAIRLHWKTTGKLRQLEKATSVLGPWKAISPITLDLTFDDPEGPNRVPQAFYRLREW